MVCFPFVEKLLCEHFLLRASPSARKTCTVREAHHYAPGTPIAIRVITGIEDTYTLFNQKKVTPWQCLNILKERSRQRNNDGACPYLASTRGAPTAP